MLLIIKEQFFIFKFHFLSLIINFKFLLNIIFMKKVFKYQTKFKIQKFCFYVDMSIHKLILYFFQNLSFL